MRHKRAPRRKTEGDKIYNSVLIAKLINSLMKDGKKTTSEKIVYAAFETLSKKGLVPSETFEKVISVIAPKVEIRAKRVGGANYQVPTEVRPERQKALAIRWLIEAARAKANKEYRTFDQKLVAEMMDVLEEKGSAVAKRNNMLKQAEANRAFAHFRF